jgi:hypothetical protein
VLRLADPPPDAAEAAAELGRWTEALREASAVETGTGAAAALAEARERLRDGAQLMVIGGGVGTVVERRLEGVNEGKWGEGYVTSLEPLLVTGHLSDGPSGEGYSWHEVRAVPAARQAELDSA